MGDVPWRMGWFFLGIAAWVTLSFKLEDAALIDGESFYRVTCIIGVVFWFLYLVWDLRTERWVRFSLPIIIATNFFLFLTPVYEGEASRGEAMFPLTVTSFLASASAAAANPLVDDSDRARGQWLVFTALASGVLMVGLIAFRLSQNDAPI